MVLSNIDTCVMPGFSGVANVALQDWPRTLMFTISELFGRFQMNFRPCRPVTRTWPVPPGTGVRPEPSLLSKFNEVENTRSDCVITAVTPPSGVQGPFPSPLTGAFAAGSGAWETLVPPQ